MIDSGVGPALRGKTALAAWDQLRGPLADARTREPGGWPQPANSVPAAVLVGLWCDCAEPGIILTRRASHLRDHPGQVSFPGGCLEAADNSPEAGALREAHEEIGLQARDVELLGRMAPYRTGTGFLIEPVIGTLRTSGIWEPTPQPDEVAEVFVFPLERLLDPDERDEIEIAVSGQMLRFPAFHFEGRLIWGATAGILWQLADLITDTAVVGRDDTRHGTEGAQV